MTDKLTTDQTEFAIRMFATWMRVCEDNNRRTSPADVDHSALLRRLLQGGALLDEPPPLRFSYPAWELVEEDEVEIYEISTHELNVAVDQHPGYIWENQENKILTYVRTGLRFQYSEREVLPEVHRLKKGLKPEDHKYVGKFLRRLK